MTPGKHRGTLPPMARKRIPYRIERTRNKHSRAVLLNDRIIIRLARNLNTAQEREHITYLLRSMQRQLLRRGDWVTVQPFRHLLEGGFSQHVRLATGKTYKIILETGNRSGFVRKGNTLRISVGPRTVRSTLHRTLWKAIANAEQARMERLVHAVNAQTLHMRIRSVRLRFTASQWGSCSPRGIVAINAALLFMPQPLLRYIIVHEIAHRKHANHSPAFWRLVASACPQYERLRNELRHFHLPSLS